MKRLLLPLLSLLALVLTSCMDTISGSGIPAVRSYDNTEFTQVRIEDACNATVTEGDAYKVEIEIDDNLQNYVIVSQQGSTLHIGLRDNISYRNIDFRATVTLPSLTALKAEDASHVTIHRNDSLSALSIVSEDASGISGTLRGTTLTATVEDASDINLDGKVETVRLTCSDASDARLRDLPCSDMQVQISDASSCQVTVTNSISGSVSDASTLSYYGNPPVVTVTTSDASHLIKKN